jgi:UTP:GlnB (protein PII) uridylyltransferase
LGADPDIVQIGTRLMDIKLGEARAKGDAEGHVVMGVVATRAFLSRFGLGKAMEEKIVNCVEGHL